MGDYIHRDATSTGDPRRDSISQHYARQLEIARAAMSDDNLPSWARKMEE